MATIIFVTTKNAREVTAVGTNDGVMKSTFRSASRKPAPLPSVAGNVVVTQRLSDYDVASVGPVWTAGVCEMRRFRFMAVRVDWFPSTELVPFGEAVLGRGGWHPDDSRFWKGYGSPLSNAAPYGGAVGSVSCDRSLNKSLGFVDGRGTFTLRSQLAGTLELPAVSMEVQLDCPPSELVGPCFDAGPDASIDAPYPDTGAPPNADTGALAPDTGAPDVYVTTRSGRTRMSTAPRPKDRTADPTVPAIPCPSMRRRSMDLLPRIPSTQRIRRILSTIPIAARAA